MAEIGARDIVETEGDSLRQVQDFKVGAHESVGDFQLISARKAMTLAAKGTCCSQTYGSRRRFCQGSVLL